MLNRSKLWAVGLLLAVFAAGIAVGGAVSAAWGNDDSPRAEARERSRDDRRSRVSYGDRLQEALDLSAEQREAVDGILARRQTAMDELWGKVRPEFKALWEDVRNEILNVLDEQQQVAYRELLARSDSARAARERRGKRNDK